MALIICPECQSKVSDKAISCPHCGYPINLDKTMDTNKRGEYTDAETKNSDMMCIIDGIKFDLSDVMYHIIQDTAHNPKCDKSGIKKEGFYLLYDKYKMEFPEALNLYNNIRKTQQIPEKYNTRAYCNANCICPKCWSTSVTTGKRGFSVVTGFLGSNKTINRCGSCGYSWKAGE